MFLVPLSRSLDMKKVAIIWLYIDMIEFSPRLENQYLTPSTKLSTESCELLKRWLIYLSCLPISERAEISRWGR